MGKKKTHEEYVKEIWNLVHNEYSVLGQYSGSNNHVLMKHNTCGNEWLTTPNVFLDGSRCPKCAWLFEIVIGENDLWTTHPNIAMLLKNPEDGYSHTHGTNRKAKWLCPECGNEMIKPVARVVTNGLYCNICSDNNSFPNRFMGNVLSSLNIDYISEKTFKWSNRKKYDFFIPKYNLIIEMFGLQHYENGCFKELKNSRTLSDEQKNDNFKKTIAMKNDIQNYFIIDSRKSEMEWIKNSLLSSDISKIINFSKVNWIDCYNKSFNSKLMKAVDMWNSNVDISNIAKALKVTDWTVRTYLIKANKAKLCNYEKKGKIRNSKKVICLQTKEIYDNAKEAGIKNGLSDGTNITKCCRGMKKYIGWNESLNEYLKWMYYDDFVAIGGEAIAS